MSEYTLRSKIEQLKAGERVITNDVEMDAMIDLDGDTMQQVRSIPNPKRCGVWDQYVAWIGPNVDRIEYCRENG